MLLLHYIILTTEGTINILKTQNIAISKLRISYFRDDLLKKYNFKMAAKQTPYFTEIRPAASALNDSSLQLIFLF